MNINDNEDQSTEIVRIELPMRKALPRSAQQNFDRDVRLGNVSKLEWDELQMEYLSEARALLLRDGENMKPVWPDVEHIVLSKSEQ